MNPAPEPRTEGARPDRAEDAPPSVGDRAVHAEVITDFLERIEHSSSHRLLGYIFRSSPHVFSAFAGCPSLFSA